MIIHSIAYREATKADLRETVDVYLECVRADYSFKPKAYLDAKNVADELAECEDWLYASGQPNRIYVAMDSASIHGETMAGYVAVGPNIGEPIDYEGEVSGFFTRRAYRNLGIGLNLLRIGLEYLQALGYRKVVIYNYRISESNGYYRRLGGQVVRQEIQRAGEMELETDIFGYEIEPLLRTLEQRLKKYP